MNGIKRLMLLVKQRLHVAVFLIIVGSFIFLLVRLMGGGDSPVANRKIHTKVESVDMTLEHVSRWTHEVGIELKAIQSEIKKNQEELSSTRQEMKHHFENKNLDKERFQKLERDLRDQMKVSMEIAVKIATQSAKKAATNKIIRSNEPYRDAGAGKNSGLTSQASATKSIVWVSGFAKTVVPLSDGAGTRIKAGDIVEATLLGGVVVSTGTTSSQDPRPVVLELVDGRNLPRWFINAEKKCRVIGAAHGNISDERVYIRLETLACSNRKTGLITEQQISGYVSGEDGRTGLRGTLVIRDRELMMNSLLGGVLGGAASTIGQMASPTSSYNPFTGDVNRGQNTVGVLKQAGSQGASNALDRFAKYYIDRAEMLEPVIQISAGRTVDIVFTKGVTLGHGNKRHSQQRPSSASAQGVNKPYNLQGAQSRQGYAEGEDFVTGITK